MDKINFLMELFVLILIVEFTYCDSQCNCSSLMDEQVSLQTKVTQMELDYVDIKSRLEKLEATQRHSTRPNDQKTSEEISNKMRMGVSLLKALFGEKRRRIDFESNVEKSIEAINASVNEFKMDSENLVRNHSNTFDEKLEQPEKIVDEVVVAINKTVNEKIQFMNVSLYGVIKDLSETKTGLSNIANINKTINEEIQSMNVSLYSVMKDLSETKTGLSNIANINKTISEEIQSLNVSLYGVMVDLSETNTGLSNIANINKIISEEIQSLNVSLYGVMEDLSETKTGLSNLANINKTINEEIQSMNVSLYGVMEDLSETKTGLSNLANINKTINEEIQSMNVSLYGVLEDLSETKTGLSNLEDETINNKKDGAWSSWQSWGSCSASCGDGIKSRSRTCSNPKPSLLGRYCDGTPLKMRTCNRKQCAEYNVAFTAYNLDNEPSTESTLVFKYTYINKGNGYDTRTGKFTCKIPGVYHFSFTLSKRYKKLEFTNLRLRINGEYKLDLYWYSYNDENLMLEVTPLTQSGTFHLNKGDVVDVYGIPNHFCSNTLTLKACTFTGFLITPD